ncbi:hypothetical protein [Rheinheimera sp.]|uniref:hypothetical protein n=1 Tax=Rheinheimera sp. TaxID=1869214 RepID=UPI0023523457|nr:hypothetical protein [Rheinheimera sp.]|tara:strand:- start:2 stop:253 length:252 start_codon:yes stop_codon:yes gene_type:complete
MGNIINFMEKLGASAEFQELSEAEVLQMLKQAEGHTHSNFLPHVEQLLDVRKNLVCGLVPAEEPAEDTPNDDAPEDDDNTAAS